MGKGILMVRKGLVFEVLFRLRDRKERKIGERGGVGRSKFIGKRSKETLLRFLSYSWDVLEAKFF